jgi:hypothetical protein
VVLAIRAALGVANLDLPATPKKLGIAEIVFGALTVASVAVGYRLNW